MIPLHSKWRELPGSLTPNLLTRKVIRNTVENMHTRMWKKIFPKMNQLLPKDIELLERLEKGGGQGAMENFEKLLNKIVANAKRKKGY